MKLADVIVMNKIQAGGPGSGRHAGDGESPNKPAPRSQRVFMATPHSDSASLAKEFTDKYKKYANNPSEVKFPGVRTASEGGVNKYSYKGHGFTVSKTPNGKGEDGMDHFIYHTGPLSK